MTPVLRVGALDVTYAAASGADPVPAVAGLDLQVGAGEIVGLVGESGSGKSSVCGALLGLLGPRAAVRADELRLGDVDLLGLDRRGWERVRGRRVALVPQQPMTALTATVPVGRQLDWHLGAGALDRHAERLVALGLTSVVDRPGDLPAAFSGGQLQRLVIAIATARLDPDASLLLADEPTSTLDATVAATVLDLLVDLRDRRGLSLLFVSHDLATVARVCDRVGVMRRGELVELAPVDRLFADPEHPYTRALVAALPHGRRPSPPAPPPGSTPVPPVLELERLYHYYGRGRTRRGGPDLPRHATVTRAIDEVHLRIDEGRITALVGESGSGKTTLARAVAGLVHPTAGTIRLDGRELGPTRTLADRRAVQLVTQNPRAALNRRRTLRHALDQAQRVHGLGADRAEREEASRAALAQVGLPADHLARRPFELSGGELARAVLARSLLLSPRLLVLDEPTASLDAQVKQVVTDLLLELRARLGLTLLVITHELPTARALADDVAVMQHGQLVEQGPIAHVFDHPEHPCTRALLAAVPPDPRPA